MYVDVDACVNGCINVHNIYNISIYFFNKLGFGGVSLVGAQTYVSACAFDVLTILWFDDAIRWSAMSFYVTRQNNYVVCLVDVLESEQFIV